MHTNRMLSSLFLAVVLCGCIQPPLVWSQTVWIYKKAGAVQCVTDGVSFAVMKQTLTSEGIEVLSSCHSDDGFLYPAVCGGASGLINVFEIDVGNLQKAMDLGFNELSQLPGRNRVSCLPK